MIYEMSIRVIEMSNSARGAPISPTMTNRSGEVPQ